MWRPTEKVDFATRPLFEALEHDYDPTSPAPGARCRPPGRTTLSCSRWTGAPLLHLEQLTRAADGTPIEYSDVWLRADRLRVTSLLTRH